MNIKEIESTQWAKEFKKQSPTSYPLALIYSTDTNLTFDIHQSDETGEKLWVIDHCGFWMDGFTNKKDAINLCKKMNWNYK